MYKIISCTKKQIQDNGLQKAYKLVFEYIETVYNTVKFIVNVTF